MSRPPSGGASPPPQPGAGSATDRGQSTTLGFVFVFSLITLTVGVTLAGGLGALEDVQSAERLENTERAFEVLADNLDDVAHEGAPSRATEFKLAGGRLELAEPTTITVRAVNSSDPADNATFSATGRPITYSDDGTTVAYSFGAVVRADDAALFRSSPDWLVDEERAVLPLVIVTSGQGATAVGGTRTVLVVTEAASRGPINAFTTGPGSEAEVNVTVESPYAGAWARYIESLDLPSATALDADPADDDGDGTPEVSYRFRTDDLYVPRVSVAVEFA